MWLQRVEMGCVICEPESATLHGPTGGVSSLSRIVMPDRRDEGGGVASPELLTLSVTHFHFIICPLHPRNALTRSRSFDGDSVHRTQIGECSGDAG